MWENLPTVLTSAVSTPARAVLFFLIGTLLLCREFNAPGRVLPGVAGAVCMVLAVWSLMKHPLNPMSLVILVLASIALAISAVRPLSGIVAAAGAALTVYGARELVVARPLPWLIALAAGAVFAFVSFLLTAAVRARRNKLLSD